jgi:hypothetical protein
MQEPISSISKTFPTLSIFCQKFHLALRPIHFLKKSGLISKDNHNLNFFIFAEGAQRKEVVVEFTPDDFSFETDSAAKKAIPI